MSVEKFKPRMYLPNFEKLNQELLEECQETTASAKRAIAHTKKLTDEVQELIKEVRTKEAYSKVTFCCFNVSKRSLKFLMESEVPPVSIQIFTGRKCGL
jgi:hypothetical protein